MWRTLERERAAREKRAAPVRKQALREASLGLAKPLLGRVRAAWGCLAFFFVACIWPQEPRMSLAARASVSSWLHVPLSVAHHHHYSTDHHHHHHSSFILHRRSPARATRPHRALSATRPNPPLCRAQIFDGRGPTAIPVLASANNPNSISRHRKTTIHLPTW